MSSNYHYILSIFGWSYILCSIFYIFYILFFVFYVFYCKIPSTEATEDAVSQRGDQDPRVSAGSIDDGKCFEDSALLNLECKNSGATICSGGTESGASTGLLPTFVGKHLLDDVVRESGDRLPTSDTSVSLISKKTRIKRKTIP